MKNTILGAIAGDIIGSVYEWNNYKGKDFLLLNSQCRFTDDTVMTVAVADALMTEKDVARTLQQWGRKYPGRGYGGLFRKWLTMEKPEPYHSYGNGSAMRVSAAGCMAKSISEAEELAVKSAEVTHNHPEGLKGAKAVAAAVYFAKIGASKKEIREQIETFYGYSLHFTLDEIRASYSFDVTCQGSVPQAIVAFLESCGYEDALRNAISIGGDSDTIACITGGISAAFYGGVPSQIREFAWAKLPSDIRDVITRFEAKFSE